MPEEHQWLQCNKSVTCNRVHDSISREVLILAGLCITLVRTRRWRPLNSHPRNKRPIILTHYFSPIFSYTFLFSFKIICLWSSKHWVKFWSTQYYNSVFCSKWFLLLTGAIHTAYGSAFDFLRILKRVRSPLLLGECSSLEHSTLSQKWRLVSKPHPTSSKWLIDESGKESSGASRGQRG